MRFSLAIDIIKPDNAECTILGADGKRYGRVYIPKAGKVKVAIDKYEPHVHHFDNTVAAIHFIHEYFNPIPFSDSKMQQDPPVEWSYQVTDTFYAGDYPFKKDVNEGKEKLKLLTDFGIKHFIDLTEGHQREYLTEYKNFLSPDCTYLNLPTIDVTVPSFENLKRVHDVISKSKEKVYVHCKGGFDRTSCTVATYFIYQGKTVEGAKQLYLQKAAKQRLRYAPHLPLLETKWEILDQYREWLRNHKRVEHGKQENVRLKDKILGGILGLAVKVRTTLTIT